ncbi:YadA-like family protein [Bartonella sp. B41]
MKKSCFIFKENCLKGNHFTRLDKTVSLGIILIALLLSIFSAFAADPVLTEEDRASGSVGAIDPTDHANISNSVGKGSIILTGSSGDRCFADKVYDRGKLSNEPSSSIGAMTTEEQYEKFRRKKNSLYSHSKGAIEKDSNCFGYDCESNGSLPPEAFGVYSFAVGCGAYAEGSHSTAFGMSATTRSAGAQAFGVSALASGKASVAVGMGSEAAGESSVALSSLSSAFGDYSISLGYRSKATATGGIALGAYSLSNTNDGEKGYDPITNTLREDNGHFRSEQSTSHIWKSTLGALSIGDAENGRTRQIKSVAAGSVDTDAVNVAQLKALREYMAGGWKVIISGDSQNPIIFDKDSGLNFSVSDTNLKITKGNRNANVAFGLSDNIILKGVNAGKNSLTEDGLKITGGSSITIEGINAGDKKIKGVLNGEIISFSKEAVNGGQLYSISNLFAKIFNKDAGYEDQSWIFPKFSAITKFNDDGTAVKTNYSNVSDAFEGINSGLLDVKNRLDWIKNSVDNFSEFRESNLLWDSEKGAYYVAHENQQSQQRKIVNKADGQGVQLWKTDEDVTVVEKKIDDLSDTVAGMGNTLACIENKVNTITDGVVTYDESRDGKKINKITLAGGDESEPVLIDNLADGHIESGSKEAVNGGQMHDYTEQQMQLILSDAKQYTDKRVSNLVVDAIDDAVERSKYYADLKFKDLSYGIKDTLKEARQSAAIGLAVSNLRYNDAPGKLSIAFGSGLWRNQTALALGTGYTSENGNIRSNLSVTTSGGYWGVGAGLSITLN